MLCVFSISISVVGAQCALVGRMAASMSFQCRMPSLVGTARIRQPENHASIESSQSSRCARESQITSWPCSVCIFTAMVLPMVPVGTKSAGFFAHDFGRALFQTIDGGVFAINVVAHFGFGHGAPHLRAWGL